MRGNQGSPRNLSHSERIDIRKVADPIEFIAEEHLRQRFICAEIDRLVAEDAAGEEDARAILAHLEEELPLHLRDEEEDLFPLLRRRCDPEEEIEETLTRLAADHAEGEDLGARAGAALKRLVAEGPPLTSDEAAALTAFAAHERRHLIVENAIILPLARALLTDTDRQTLRLRMAERRGVSLA